MDTELPQGARSPELWEALVSLVSLIIGIGTSIFFFGLDPQIPLLLGVIVASLMALRCGFHWDSIQSGMVKGITNALPAIIILIVVGILIGVWILGGVVPVMIYYGLQILSPSIFLPATLVLCAIVSLATGTSWGTTGTVGVALIGIGSSLGIPLPVVAGAVLSGAYFGDKMSPLSDTTNLTPAMAGTDLFTHIRHMSYTTGVSFGITLIIEIVLGLRYSASGGQPEQVNQMLTAMEDNYDLNPILLLAPVLVMVISFKKVPAIPGITIGAIVGGIFAFLFQGANWPTILDAAMYGVASETGIAEVDDLLSRGGLESMLWTISLIVAAMMFGGVMERTQQLATIADAILSRVKSRAGLITSTALTAIGANMVLCDQYMSIVMTARTYRQAYEDRELAPENLSRATEDAGTVTANLVPWNSGGAYQSATLGVATLAYLPFNFFCWISPIVTILYGIFGITIKPLQKEGSETESATA